MKTFSEFRLITEAFSELSKDEFMDLVNNPGETLVHFSNSNIFPPTPGSRGGMTGYNAELVGSKLGRSTTKPKNALFFWFLKDIQIPTIPSEKMAVSGLFTQRPYLYLVDLPTNTASILKVSSYTEKQFTRDIQRLKTAGYNLLQSDLPLNLKNTLLDTLEFGSLDQFNLVSPQNQIPKFSNILSEIWPQFSKEQETITLGRTKVNRLPTDLVKQSVFILLAVKNNPQLESSLVYKGSQSFSDLDFVKQYGSVELLQQGKSLGTLAEVLDGKQLDIPATLKKLATSATKTQANTITPADYIAAMNTFIEAYAKKSGIHFNLNHPAWKLWLTILFFSLDPTTSWTQLWKLLDYSVIIDDDPETQIVPGLEKMMVANLGGGESGIERILTRIDNEGVQVVVIDPTALRNIRRFTLSELQSQESE